MSSLEKDPTSSWQIDESIYVESDVCEIDSNLSLGRRGRNVGDSK